MARETKDDDSVIGYCVGERNRFYDVHGKGVGKRTDLYSSVGQMPESPRIRLICHYVITTTFFQPNQNGIKYSPNNLNLLWACVEPWTRKEKKTIIRVVSKWRHFWDRENLSFLITFSSGTVYLKSLEREINVEKWNFKLLILPTITLGFYFCFLVSVPSIWWG